MTDKQIKEAAVSGTLIESSFNGTDWIVFGTMKGTSKGTLSALARCHGENFYRIAGVVYKATRTVVGNATELNYKQIN